MIYSDWLNHFSLEHLRCGCAETWRNISSVSGNEKETIHLQVENAPKCKSIQFNEKKKECKLNENDHSGKTADLVYDKNTDYHYVSCEIGCKFFI